MSDTQPIGIKGLRALSQSQLITRLQASERRNEQVEQKKQELTDELVRKHQQQMSHHVSYHEAVTERDDFKRQLNEQQGQINTLSSEWQKQQGQHQAQLNHLNNKLNQKQTKIDRLQALVVSRNDELTAKYAHISEQNVRISAMEAVINPPQAELANAPANSRSDKPSGGSTKS